MIVKDVLEKFRGVFHSLQAMKQLPMRSPAAKVGGLFYFGRMLDKMRAQANAELPADYQPNLGRGFDKWCVDLLQIDYELLVRRVLKGGSDDEILQWAFEHGRRPTENDIWFWNEFMRKRGWCDDITEALQRRKEEAGMGSRSEIETMFAFIDADEGRSFANAV